MSARVLALGLDLNEDLGEFHDDSYDVVILSQILQAVVCLMWCVPKWHVSGLCLSFWC
ncbi:homoserine O-acetyltransferase [Cutibacterium acnes JCM 18918]|nr:homoserine O-acetyltransferase [Cutibacterium acnes JCM 18918]